MVHRPTYLGLGIILLAFYGCKVDSSKPTPDNAAGSGNTSHSGGAGGTAGSHSTGGSSSGTVGEAGGDVGGAAGEAGESGTSHAGASGHGGSHSSGGSSGAHTTGGTDSSPGGEAGTDAGGASGGQGQGDTDTGPLIRDDLPGPDDDSITILDNALFQGKGSAYAVFFDDKGNVYATGYQTLIGNPDPTAGFLAKLDDSLHQVWFTTIPSGSGGLSMKGAAGDGKGNTYLVGDNTGVDIGSDAARGGGDFVVARYLSDGTQDWIHQYGSAGNDEADQVQVLSDGSAFLTGTCTGQLPGQPSSLAGRPFVANYGKDGTLQKAQQFVPPTASGDYLINMAADKAGNAYVSFLGGILKFNPASEALVWSKGGPSETDVEWQRTLGVNPSGTGLYSFGQNPADTGSFTSQLQRIDPTTGDVMWVRNPGTKSVVLDEVEGLTWHGAFMGSTAMTVADDAVYIAGVYSNTYQYGSAPPPDEQATFVARYTLKGEQVWFRQFQQKASIYRYPGRPWALAVGPNGQLAVLGVGYPSDNGPAGWMVYKLNTSDGSLR